MMTTKQKLLSFFLIFTSVYSYSQNEYLDYMVTKNNDTIYGTIRIGYNDFVLFEKKAKYKKGGLKSISHKLKRSKSLRYNDKIYTYQKRDNSDGIYDTTSKEENKQDNLIETKFNKDYINIEDKLTDYVITTKSDTLFGTINKPLIGKLYLVTENNVKIKIEKNEVLEYRFNNSIYNYLKIPNKIFLIDENDYLRLVSSGNIKIYKLIINSDSKNFPLGTLNYYIIKDNEISHIHSLNYKKKLSEILIENQELVDKINENEYTLENMYLIGKYYNNN
ncbi:hypothetical protein [uncultured Flavobacterium sp.]|uniref:hypothetical protein n=1 Tax=uncultured Flavobacterium sp. TaxID=165435 RepID=UPI0030EC34AC